MNSDRAAFDHDDSAGDPPPPTSAAPAVRALRDLLVQPSPAQLAGDDASRATERLPSVPGYDFLDELGRGGMGCVFRARHRSLGRLVALKFVFAGRYADAVRRARFQNEAETVARLQHPNIVQIYEVGEHDGCPYLALEFVEGGDLGDKLAGGPLPASAAAALVETLARAVSAAHARGVIHRDLKPANILLTADGTPKISDFGLAKQLDDAAGQTQIGTIVGTPSYMAPEQAEGKTHEVGPPADIYALGAILYEVLTGRPPFHAASVLETLDQVRHRDPLPPRQLQPGVPRDLQTICMKCLEKDAAKRYASAQELAADLARFRGGEPILARPVGRVERLLKWTRRRPALAALYGVSTLAMVTLIGGGLLYQTELAAALRRAEANEARADAGYKSARAALQNILSRLEERDLADVPQLRELQRQQYEDALVFYREILKYQEDPDPAVRLDIAVALRDTGSLQHRLGQNGPAEENYRQSIAMLERLINEHPEHTDYHAQLASTCNNMAILVASLAKKEEAERWHRRAIDIRAAVHRLRPDDPTAQEQLAQSYHMLGSLYQTTGRDGIEHYEKALALREPLLRAHPENIVVAARTADTYSAYGVCLLYHGKPEKGEEGFRKAEAILIPLVRDHPQKVQHALALAGLRINWTLFLQKEKRLAEALEKSALAIRDLEEVLRREPNLVHAQLNLLNAHGGRAQSLAGLGRFGEAVPHWDRLLTLAEKHPNRDVFRLERAMAIARAGKHAEAVAEVDAFTKGAKAEWLYHLACVSARAVEAVARDDNVAPAEQARLADTYAAKAVALLTRAHEAGYFNAPARILLLGSDAHLQSLRQRADFQEVQQAVETNDKKKS